MYMCIIYIYGVFDESPALERGSTKGERAQDYVQVIY